MYTAAVDYSDGKAMAGYSSSQASGAMSRDHGGWHSAVTSSKQHGYGAPAAAASSQWTNRGTASSAASVSARSNWSSGGVGSVPGVGSSFASSAKNVMGSGGVSASAHEPRYDAYKQMPSSGMRRY